MSAAVSFPADVANDGHYVIALAQTGTDTATLEIRKWSVGGAPPSAPESTETYALQNIRASADKLTCEVGQVWFVTPQIEIDLSAPTDSPAATVTVSHSMIGDGTKDYPLTHDDRDAIAAFLTDAKFPAI